VGAAMLAAGVVFGLQEAKAYGAAQDLVNQASNGSVISKADFDSAKGRTRTWAWLADGSYAAGAVCAGVGLYLTFAGSSAAVTAAPVAHGGAIAISGEF